MIGEARVLNKDLKFDLVVLDAVGVDKRLATRIVHFAVADWLQ